MKRPDITPDMVLAVARAMKAAGAATTKQTIAAALGCQPGVIRIRIGALVRERRWDPRLISDEFHGGRHRPPRQHPWRTPYADGAPDGQVVVS